jgi:protein-ribulosamine 3-kinase
MLPLPISKSIAEFLQNKIGKEITIHSSSTLSGGCINNAIKIQTSAGIFFTKYNLTLAYPEMFTSEAAGLQLLREADEIRIPEVICCGTIEKYSFLLLEFIASENRCHNFWEIFGRALAGLHKHTQPFFGLNRDNYIGSLPQRNHPHQEWINFFILERMEPLIKLARDKGEITVQLVNQFSILFSRLQNLIPAEKSALVHGDLWNGNYLVDEKGHPCLFDPAVYYGHREMDLAMTRLFGGFSPIFYDSYNNASPLEIGWENRIDLFNLYPLLVHVNLFGGAYASQVKQIVSRFV